MLKPSPACRDLRDVPEPLHAFIERYFVDDRIQLKPPQDNILIVDGVISIILYREGQFQVELVIVEPNKNVPQHCHDDADSYEVGLSGGLELFIEGTQAAFTRPPAPNGMSRDFARYVPVPHDAFHGGRIGPKGVCFLSVQKWRDGVQPIHIALNWRGTPLGEQHEEAVG